MTRLYIVRNGRTEEGTGFIENPGLDEVGQVQAEAVAGLLGSLPRMRIFTSPQKRALETAEPVAKLWLTAAEIDAGLTLMPVPNPKTCDTASWLATFMKSTWPEAPEPQRLWRKHCLSQLTHLGRDAAIFTHFIVVNMIVGAAVGDERVTVFQPDNGSITIVDAVDGKLSLVERGRQAATRRL
jgi:broad specificity phosphatase PhoE